MESSARMLVESTPVAAGRQRVWIGVAKTALGLTIVAVLLYSGRIDLEVVAQLAAIPLSVLACLALLFAALLLSVLRWGVLLRVMAVPIPFISLYHFTAVGILTSTLLPGSTGGDAVRAVYAWRAFGGGASRIAVSLVADRVLALFGTLALLLAFVICSWGRIQQTPGLAALGRAMVLAVAICAVATCALFFAPKLMLAFEQTFRRWPLISSLIPKLSGLLMMLQKAPLALLIAFGLAVAIQLLTVFAVIVIGNAIAPAALSTADYMFAVPLTTIANALPLTPSGLGVGEAAFDQICRWLEPGAGDVAYSSIFFSFRLVSLLIGLPGLGSRVVYRRADHANPQQN
jgi:glycosyltransferase 2 family protein